MLHNHIFHIVIPHALLFKKNLIVIAGLVAKIISQHPFSSFYRASLLHVGLPLQIEYVFKGVISMVA